MTIRRLEEYRRASSLAEAARFLAHDLQKDLSTLDVAPYLVGYHVRHVFDSTSPTIALIADTSDALERATIVHAANERVGLHSLNHVLDSLHYDVAQGPTKILVRIRFKAYEEGDHHLFDADETDLSRMVLSWVPGWTFDPVAPSAEAITETPAEGPPVRSIYDGYLCGVQKLCSMLDIEPSIVAYHSIMAAVFQLGTFAHIDVERSYDYSYVFMMRPANPFAAVTGITLLTKTELSEPNLRSLEERLATDNTELNAEITASRPFPTDGRDLPNCVRDLKDFKGISVINDPPVPAPPRGIVERVAARVPNAARAVTSSVKALLSLATQFCDERIEGRPLSYGLVLGNPHLVKYWPGPQPLPLTFGSTAQFYTFEELPKFVHLLDDPQQHCLMIPYTDGARQLGDTAFPSFVLSFSDLLEGLSARRDHALWPPELRPYVFLTRRYPWAIAVIAGPGSELRVFASGDIVAYRDGKGWRAIVAPMIVESLLAATNRDESFKETIRLLARIALQMSPFVRTHAHGGLLAYLPIDVNDDRWAGEEQQLQKLVIAEPENPSAERWLTGRELLNADLTINTEVFERVLRAGLLDGAIVFCDPRCTVKYFGRRLAYGDTNAPAAGTKRKTAAAFVEQASLTYGPESLAFAVSSDGPVRLYTKLTDRLEESLLHHIAD